jgi:hypothetical protein
MPIIVASSHFFLQGRGIRSYTPEVCLNTLTMFKICCCTRDSLEIPVYTFNFQMLYCEVAGG